MPGNRFQRELEFFSRQSAPTLADTHLLEFKPVFGAIGGYVDGKIFVSCGKFGIALKLPPETLAELFMEQDVRQLKYFPNGHVKKKYAVLPPRILEDFPRIANLVEASLLYARQEGSASGS